MNNSQLCFDNQIRSTKITFQSLPSHIVYLPRLAETLNSGVPFASDQTLQILHLHAVCCTGFINSGNKLTRPLRFFKESPGSLSSTISRSFPGTENDVKTAIVGSITTVEQRLA